MDFLGIFTDFLEFLRGLYSENVTIFALKLDFSLDIFLIFFDIFGILFGFFWGFSSENVVIGAKIQNC